MTTSVPTKPVPATTSAVLVRAAHDHVLVEREVPRPGPDEVLVEVAAAGICGSDLELFSGTRPTAYVSYPVVPGHEWSGRVAVVGSGVTRLAAGDPVVAQGFRHCGVCPRCREGSTNLCAAGYAETGFTHPGAFSGYVLVPARLVHLLTAPPGSSGAAGSDGGETSASETGGAADAAGTAGGLGGLSDADLEAAALLEPSACVAEGMLAASPLVGARAAVLGTGTLSLVAVQLLARQGARDVIVIGDSPSGRELASHWGATGFVGTAEASEPGWTCEADYVFESSGRRESARQAVAAARRGGTVVLEGIPDAAAEGDLTDIVVKHLHVRGIFGASAAAWEQVVTLFGAGLLELAPLISHRFGLGAVEEALATLRERRPGVRKVLLRP